MQQLNTHQKAVLNLIRQFVNRQRLVFEAIRELRPTVLLSTGAIKREDLVGKLKLRSEIPDKGLWGKNKEWEYSFHGLGCKLTHMVTREPIEWNAPSINNFDRYWFMNWTNWYLQQNSEDSSLQSLKSLLAESNSSIEELVFSILNQLEAMKIVIRSSTQYPNEYTFVSMD